jgi:hypothetical protein
LNTATRFNRTAFSVLIRLELSGPGVQYIADNQLYNSIITAHAIIMIFFMVEKKLILKFQLSPFFYKVDNDNNNLSLNVHNDPNLNGNQNFNDNNEHKNDKKHNYIKVLVDDPFNNRNIILNVTKSQKGIYI